MVWLDHPALLGNAHGCRVSPTRWKAFELAFVHVEVGADAVAGAVAELEPVLDAPFATETKTSGRPKGVLSSMALLRPESLDWCGGIVLKHEVRTGPRL